MKLKKFKDKNSQRKKIILTSLIAIILVSFGFLLSRTFASFQENKSFKIMEGTFDYYGGSDVYFAFFNGSTELDTIPAKNSGLYLDENKSNCTSGAYIKWDKNNWTPTIVNLSNAKTKCSLVFSSNYQDSKSVGAPVLYDGLIPVKFDNGTLKTVDASTSWYDYDNHEWANAILINYEDSTTKAKYFDGTTPKSNVTVDVENDVLQMYVWIPRYKYLLWNAENGVSNPQAIDIEFVNTHETNPSGKLESAYQNGEWYVHPAFTFGTTELPGIWVGKFEMGGSAANPLIKPNVQSLTSTTAGTTLNVSTMFNTLQNMTNAKYGINTTTSDRHMMKNSEWGAVAYLSHSIYGRYNADKTCISSGCQVWINNVNTGYGGDSSTYSGQPQWGPAITGCAGTGDSVGVLNNQTACPSGYDWLQAGVNASTTGNAYGIYDMSGGAWEYVMGVQYASDGTTIQYGSSGFNAGTMPDSKYYDIYGYEANAYGDNVTSSDIENSLARYHLGEGTRETLTKFYVGTGAAWYNDWVRTIYSSYPWVGRGGFYYDTSGAGLFNFGRNGGGAWARTSFRSSFTGK